MRKIYLLLLVFFFAINCSVSAQDGGVSIGKGQNPAHTKAILELFSQDKGLLIPRMDGGQRNAMFLADDLSAKGMLVYDTDDDNFYFWTGTAWSAVGNELKTLSGDAFPSDAVLGQVFYNTSSSLLSVFTESGWESLNFDIINDLTSGGDTSALSAEQGKILKALIDVNTAKTGITAAQAADITANNAKLTYTDGAAVALNTAKVGITAAQAADITANNAKLTYTDGAAVALNTAKVGITAAQAADITANNAKLTYTDGAAVALNTAKVGYTDALVSANTSVLANTNKTTSNASGISALEIEQITQNTAIALNTAKTGITAAQAADIAANNAKLGITPAIAADITANTAKVGYTDALVSANASVVENTNNTISNASSIIAIKAEQVGQNGLITSNTDKITLNTSDINTIKTEQVSQNGLITSNTDKTNVNAGDINTIKTEQISQNGLITSNTDKTNVNAGDINTIKAEQISQDGLIALNTAKVGITVAQAADITTNNAKLTYTDALIVAQNTDKITDNLNDINSIKTEQITQNEDIALNTNKITNNTSDINSIQTEQTQQNVRLTQNTNSINQNVLKIDQNTLSINETITDLNSHVNNILNPHGVTASQIGLGNVDNTSDEDKPLSAAALIALDLKENTVNKSIDTNLGVSNVLYPTQNAVKTYVDNLSIGLNWKNPVEFINTIGDVSAPITPVVHTDGYIISAGGNIGDWAGFAPGDLVQYQTDRWVKIKSLVVGDYFGVAFKSSTPPVGGLSGHKNEMVEITGGTPGAFTYTFTTPVKNDALFVQNPNAYYHNVTYSYSESLTQWVQLSASVNFTFDNGLNTVGNTISLGDLNSDWTQSGAFDIITSGGITLMNDNNISMTGSLGDVGARLTKGWFTDLEVTNAIAGSVTGNAATVTTNADLTGHITSNGNVSELGSFSSANLASALTDETGTGSAVFSVSPVFTGTVTGISPDMVGLGNVDNTSDLSKPVSTATLSALDLKVDKNAGITGGVGTKITYDAKGLVTAGGNATTADIAESTNKNYVSDAQSLVIANTSGTNTGDQDISGILTNSGDISALKTEQIVQNTAIALNTDKVGISSGQASEITANTAKQGYTEALVSANASVVSNTNKIDANISALGAEVIRAEAAEAALSVVDVDNKTASEAADAVLQNYLDAELNRALAVEAALGTISSDNKTAIEAADLLIAANTAKTGITVDQANEITANTAKLAYSDALVALSPAVIANTAKVSYTDAAVSNVIAANPLVAANTAKTGITTSQASEISVNTNKVGYEDALVSANTSVVANTNKSTSNAGAIAAIIIEQGVQNAAIGQNTAKVGITAAQANEIDVNSAKLSYTDAAAVSINSSKVGYTDVLVSANTSVLANASKSTNNASDISAIQAEQTIQNGAIALNTAKLGITLAQAGEITANSLKISYTDAAAVALNTAKVGITSGQASEITANTAKTSYTDAAIVSSNTNKIGINVLDIQSIKTEQTQQNTRLDDFDGLVLGNANQIQNNKNDILTIQTAQGAQDSKIDQNTLDISLNTSNIINTNGELVSHVNDVGNPHLVTATQVNLGNVDNTSDEDKPLSAAAVIALDLKENVANKSTDGNLGSSNVLYPTQNAVKTYVDNLSIGLNWKNPVEFINTIGEASAPIFPVVHTDGYIISAGGNTGDWLGFAPGDLVQYQTDRWVKIKSLAVGDYFGVAFKSSTPPVGGLIGHKNEMVEITGGTSGAFTYTFTAPLKNDALFVENPNAYYHNVTYSYSTSLVQWVQLSASVDFTFDSGLNTVGNTISLGELTSDWNQTAAFDIITSGGLSLLGGNNILMTGSLGESGARLTKGWFTDLEVTNDIVGSVTGNAATVTTNANLTGHIVSNGNVSELGTFSSTNLASALSDESGTGSAVFSVSPVFTGTPSLPVGTIAVTKSTGDNSTAIATTAYADAAVAAVNSSSTDGLALKANIASPTFTGTVSGITSAMVGLGNVDNTSDLLKPVSSATQTALDLKVDKNAPITGGVATKITYDAKGLVTAGVNATTADIAESTNKNYVSDAQKIVIGNTSGTNTGDQNISGILTNSSDVSDLKAEQIVQNTALALNTAKVGYTEALVSNNVNVAANTAKVGMTSGQASAIVANTAKISYTDAAAVALNTAKIGLSPSQAATIVENKAKISYTDAAAVALNSTKISYTDASAVATNTAKVGYTDALVSANTDVVANTAKIGISPSQAATIVENKAKVGYTEALVSANVNVAANTAKLGITPAQAVVIGNTSGTNTGDQSLAIVGNNLTISGGNTVVIPSVGSSTKSYVNTYITSATSTFLSADDVAEKLLGITADVVTPVNFTSAANTLTYTGSTTQLFSLVCSISLTGDRRETYTFFIAKNGVKLNGSEVERFMSSTIDVGALAVSSLISLSTGDRVEIWAQGSRGVITIETMNIFIHSL